jgi:hypothetical protein
MSDWSDSEHTPPERFVVDGVAIQAECERAKQLPIKIGEDLFTGLKIRAWIADLYHPVTPETIVGGSVQFETQCFLLKRRVSQEYWELDPYYGGVPWRPGLWEKK